MSFLRSLRSAWRSLLRTPGFLLTAVLTLALGIGGATALFSVVDAVLLRPLPYSEPERLVALYEIENAGQTDESANRMSVAPANLEDYRPLFASLASAATSDANLSAQGARAERVFGLRAEHTFFEVFGVRPAAGRALEKSDEVVGAPEVVILSHALFERRFGGDRGILGRSITLDGESATVVGILPKGFHPEREAGSPNPLDILRPARYDAQLLANRGDHEVLVFARLARGTTIAGAQSALDAVSARLAKAYPDTNGQVRARIAPLRDDFVRGVRSSLWILFGSVAVLLLVASVNVANLLLVRGTERASGLAVRLALGASRFRLVRETLAEVLLVAGLGFGLGAALAAAGKAALVSLAPSDVPRLANVALDLRVLAISAGAVLFIQLVFGLLPAFAAARVDPARALVRRERGGGGHAVARFRSALVVAEIALSLVLLIGGALFSRSFARLVSVDLGYRTGGVLAANVALAPAAYDTPEKRLRFFEAVTERVSALPGVSRVAFANRMPLRGGWGSGVELEGSEMAVAEAQAVSTGYFEVLGIPLKAGRNLTHDDREGAPPVALVNETFVRTQGKGRDLIGQRLRRGPKAPWITIVGVVGDVRRGGKDEDLLPHVYLSAAQTGVYPVRLSDLAILSAVPPETLIPSLERAVAAVDPDQPLTNVRTLDQSLARRLARQRFVLVLSVVFASLSGLLAAVGLYGVIAYGVAQRRHELGVRAALGADGRRIARLVLSGTARLAGAGLALGLLLALPATLALRSLLFGIDRLDPMAWGAAAAALFALALLATLGPVLRATRVDPAEVLRAE
ncbi:MAG: ABC transporter permease [Acidobacteria bacterium]|nr:ABC transporter permease [Acidobacteriota bacterium]